MNTLKYKGYVGSVGFSETDQVFFGTIEGIDGLVNYEGESVAELTAAFEEAVDDYLAFCEGQGIKPEKSYTGTFNVRIAPAVHREIANLASSAGISINAFVKKVLSDAVETPMHYGVTLLNGYSCADNEQALLMEPPATYGAIETLEVQIPRKDLELIRTIAERMGWKVSK